MSVRLSVCIATLNRGPVLGATLESILTQATEEVEVVIVDGASTDNTREVAQSYQARYPLLRYERLAARGGVDQDYCRAVELARGDFVWLFTDDDLLKPGAIAAVLQAIKPDDSLIIINAEVRDVRLERLLLPSRVRARTDRVYAPAEQPELLAEAGDYLSFVGAVIIRRTLWEAREKARYLGTEFVHVGVIFQARLPGPARLLVEPGIIIRYGAAQWTRRAFEIWMFKWPRLIWSFEHLPAAARLRVTPPEPWRRPWALFLFRARGAYAEAEFQRLIAPQPQPPWARALARVVAHFPGCLANLLARLYAALRGFQPLSVDLRNSPFDYRRCRAGLSSTHPTGAET